MQNQIVIKKKIKNYNKKIIIPGDKSLSIRWVLISSLANGISKAKNLLMSEDVIATVSAIRKLGVRVKINNSICKIHGVGIDGYKYKKNLVTLRFSFTDFISFSYIFFLHFKVVPSNSLTSSFVGLPTEPPW